MRIRGELLQTGWNHGDITREMAISLSLSTKHQMPQPSHQYQGAVVGARAAGGPAVAVGDREAGGPAVAVGDREAGGPAVAVGGGAAWVRFRRGLGGRRGSRRPPGPDRSRGCR